LTIPVIIGGCGIVGM